MRFLQFIRTAVLYYIYLNVLAVAYVVVWLDRKIKFKLPFPRDLAELQKSEMWCMGELKKAGALPDDSVISHYSVKPLKPDLIYRSDAGVIEIAYNSAGVNKTLRCFAKFAPTMGTVWNKTIFNVQANHIKESHFNEYFVKQDPSIPAPKVFVSQVYLPTGHLCLITEMMDDCMEHPEAEQGNISDKNLQLALEGLATLHAAYWKSTAARMDKVMPIADSTVYVFEMMVLFSWSKAARKILTQSWINMNVNETVLHGDARVGNMLFPKPDGSGRFVFIDWQAVRKGKAAFDLAYFLVLSMPVKHRREVESKCLDDYHKHLVTRGVKDYTRETLEVDYRDACLCVLALLSLPMLSGEVSAEGKAAENFVWGMSIWRDRVEAKFREFDYRWMSARYGLTEEQCGDAIAEMLQVITDRLEKVTKEKVS